MHIEQGLKCPFSLEEMKAHYAMEPLTYATYVCMRHDYDSLIRHNRANGIGFHESLHNVTCYIVPEELKISVYLGNIYQAVRYGGPE
ncbi:hypothetical protein UGMREWDR_CDS0025 [Aeromonas phage GomatiRiver_11]|nr:hypothetical protein OBDJBBDK_00024 [Aeromonas phage AhFM11]WKW84192.1 hypothetical protein UGMREWDR_CDS0025 [Aeromonas phage GomatiRiver_11]